MYCSACVCVGGGVGGWGGGGGGGGGEGGGSGRCDSTKYKLFFFTVELQWLEHLWDHEN